MPLITTLAGASARGYGGLRTFGVPSSYESIATVTAGSGGISQIDFTSIPSTYEHLQIRFIWRSANASEISLSFNSDGTGSNYYRHLLYGSGGGVAATASNTNSFGGYYEPVTSVFNGTIIDILDYKNTNKYKTVRIFYGYDGNGSGYLGLYSGLWKNTNAISSITLSNSGGANIGQYSSFALYGIKGS